LTPEVFIQLAEDAHKALHQHHLHDALYLIHMLLKDVQLTVALNDCQQLEDSYHSMLQFVITGGKDEHSKDMRSQMLESAMRLLIVAERTYRLQNDHSEYVAQQKQQEENGDTLEQLTERYLSTPTHTQEREGLLDQLFYAIWTSAPFNDGDAQQMLALFSESTDTEKCTLVSALGLSLIEYIDNQKVQLLMLLLDSNDITIKTRALTGIVFCSMIHTEDLQLYHNTFQQLENNYLLREDIQELTAQLNQAFLISLQTQSAREKLEKDILPSFMKMAKDGRVELGFSEDGDINLDIPMEHAKDQEKIMGTMREFIDMQRDGIDMNANTMLTMRNLDFFKVLPHWFLPFDMKRTELRGLIGTEDEETATMLNGIANMAGSGDCDTDRYSTAIMVMTHMSKDLKESLTNIAKTIKNEGADLEMPSFMVRNEIDGGNTAKDVCRRYLQQLYRVFTAWYKYQEWPNPFQKNANWLKNPILTLALQDNQKALHLLADYFIKYKCYQEAESYLNRLVQLEGSDAETLRSAAYCKQQQGHFGGALTLYCQADLLMPEHPWTLAQMQLCYAHLERHEQRLDCLLQLEQLEPENAKVITETGLCLMQLKRWQDASQRFYRLELEGRRVIPSQRAIAWCSLQQGKVEQALKYYHILFETPSSRWQDYLNAGHAAWIMGDTAKAVELYRGYIKRYLTDDPKITDALTPFNQDNALLLSLGKEQHEIDLMHDILE